MRPITSPRGLCGRACAALDHQRALDGLEVDAPAGVAVAFASDEAEGMGELRDC